MNKRHLFYLLPIIFLLIVAVAGWFATDFLGNKARREIIGASQASVLTLSVYVSSTLNRIEDAVKSLADSPWITPALLSKGKRDIEQANSALDRYNSAFASITYLMDADGMTVASSNRKDPDSFVEKSYGFRPYFQDAVKGKPGRYFALGVTSGKRGFYASCPVRDHLGEVTGVVTMKKDIDEIETFFSKYHFCFLISPDGIIFLSSTPAMVTKSLWPLDKSVRETLIASRQFGNQLSEAVIKNEVADGTEVALAENDYFVSRTVIDSDGWSIVLLTPTERIRHYRLIGILATISVSFLIMVFSGIVYVADRSREAIRQSEESKRLLLQAAGNGIFGVDAAGQVTFINPAALRMLGFAEEEMLGQSVHDLIHHSHQDGSGYPVEDCPMYATYTHAADSNVTDEVLWRKDGGNFPVEYTSMPITKDGKVIGAVVNFTDISERKQAEVEKAELEAQNRQLQKAESLGHMAGAIAHHFNNKLQAVMGNLEMAMDDLPRGADILHTMTEALKAAHEAAEVSGLMLTYLGQTPGNHEPLDLSEACHKSLTLFQATLPKDMNLKADLPSFGPVIHGNAGQIQQVLTNLITNARESISDNRGTIGLTIKTVYRVNMLASKRFPIDWQPKEIAYACLEVSDTGCGIPDRDIEKLFDPFFSTKFTGRGLGLPVVMGIVKAHGGGVTVDSEPGRGSVFRIFLPLSTEELPCRHDLPAIPGTLQTGKTEKISKIEGGGTVLLIEDEDQVMAGEHPERPNAFLGKPYQLKGLSDTINRVLKGII